MKLLGWIGLLLLAGVMAVEASAGLGQRLPWERMIQREVASKWSLSTARPFAIPKKRPAKIKYDQVSGKGKVLAFTFDDGPRPWTAGVLDALKKRGIRGTFFVTGTEAVTYRKLVKRMIAEGHEVGNHTLTHKDMWMHRSSQEKVDREIRRAHEALTKITGVAPKIFRPPGGNFRDDQCQWTYDEFGYANIWWNVDPRDGVTPRPSAKQFRDRILKQVKDGSIILSHDLHRSSAAAVPATLDALIAKGYKFLTVSELIALDDPYKDLQWSHQELRFLEELSLKR